MKVLILRGVPGSGKSTYARELAHAVEWVGERVVTVSADHWFERDGQYRFDPKELGSAHAACLRKFLDQILENSDRQPDLLIVDNTNITASEIAPYYALAEAFGHEVEVGTFLCDPDKAVDRQVHGVPSHTIWRMRATMDTERLPDRWKCRTIHN